jgi:hypothetical protein
MMATKATKVHAEQGGYLACRYGDGRAVINARARNLVALPGAGRAVTCLRCQDVLRAEQRESGGRASQMRTKTEREIDR